MIFYCILERVGFIVNEATSWMACIECIAIPDHCDHSKERENHEFTLFGFNLSLMTLNKITKRTKSTTLLAFNWNGDEDERLRAS